MNVSLRILAAVSVALAAVLPLPCAAATDDPEATLTLDLKKPGIDISPTLYGLMTEEINHSYDGGIYAELIRNRTFQDDPARPVHWSALAGGTIALDSKQPLNDALPISLRLSAKGAGAGIANDGYWGIPLKPQTTYRASFYAKADGNPGTLTVSIQSRDGGTTYARAEVPKVTGEWRRYEVQLITSADVKPTSAARFAITTGGAGIVWFNLVTLFPPTYADRPNGNRVDLMELLAAMKPTFLRLPGGNYLEGETIATRFPWQRTLGRLEERPGHPGCWGYRSSDGMGLLEFLEWCEDLKVEPVLCVYAGYSLKGERVEPGPALQPFVEEALAEIEYVTGGPETKWGAVRAKNGHPAPFPLTYVEIGNEDWFDRSGSYDGRYVQFHDAIKAKYPHLQLISTVGGKDPGGKQFTVSSRKPDLIDEHYYLTSEEMQDRARHYDDYPRTGPKIFVGEWAAQDVPSPWIDAGKKGPTPTLNTALGDAAWMTGMERNSDIVRLSCYAPLLVNVNPGARQWAVNLIGYDALTSFGSPSYYAQQMFGTYLGDKLVPITERNIPTRPWQPRPPRDAKAPPVKQLPTLFAVATRSTRTGAIYLKVVNAGSSAIPVRIDLPGAANVSPDGIAVELTSSSPEDTNTIAQPTKVAPVTTKISGLGSSFTRTFAPHSVNVLQLSVLP